MFVQSARFVEEHQRNPTSAISIFGRERAEETIRLAKMNLAVHGLGGEIVPSNTYYEDPHDLVGRYEAGAGAGQEPRWGPPNELVAMSWSLCRSSRV